MVILEKAILKNLLLVFLLVMICLQKNFAASSPLLHSPADSAALLKQGSVLQQQITATSGYKMNFLHRLQWKWIQKKIKKKMRLAEEVEKNKNTVSTIALICGVGGLVVLFLVPVLGFLMMLTGIVTGAIGMSNNSNKKSRIKALIGLVAGAAGIVLVGAFIIAFAAVFN